MLDKTGHFTVPWLPGPSGRRLVGILKRFAVNLYDRAQCARRIRRKLYRSPTFRWQNLQYAFPGVAER